RDSAAEPLALRLLVEEIVSTVPTQINMTSTAAPPATKPKFSRRCVFRASQRFENAPNSSVARTITMPSVGISVDAVVWASTRADVSSYTRFASGRIGCCMSDDASDRYDEPIGLPARLFVRAVSTRPA